MVCWSMILAPRHLPFIFFFNDTATTEIYTLSLHDALPICKPFCVDRQWGFSFGVKNVCRVLPTESLEIRATQKASLSLGDRKSTRLNSSHLVISYAVFCLKKKNHYTVHGECRLSSE